MIAVVAAAVVLVLLGIVLIVGVTRRRDTGEAIGDLSRETRTRDRSSGGLTYVAEPPATGRDVEKAAAMERSGKSSELVPADRGAPPAPFVPPDADAIGVNRRQFFNRSIVTMMLLSISGFGAAVLAFLWPNLSGGFGSKIRVGKLSDILADIETNSGFLYLPEGRAWLTQYPKESVGKAKASGVYSSGVLAGMEAGVVALYQKCPHLGCRVPSCVTSQWFECPCHGSQYNQVGEKKGGPAPRGMDRFSVEVSGGALIVNTGDVNQGPPIGTNTTGQEAEGPHCTGGGH